MSPALTLHLDVDILPVNLVKMGESQRELRFYMITFCADWARKDEETNTTKDRTQREIKGKNRSQGD